jgi:RimJ/RimL family protein N-acetyltransferase
MPRAPELETPRLTLRQHRPEDFEDSAAMWADPAVVRYIGGRAFTREESWSRALRTVGLWEWLGYGYWCVREKDSGRFVGEVGFADFKRDMTPSIAGASSRGSPTAAQSPLSGVPEGGWVLGSWAHGQGFASEAVARVLAWMDEQGHARTVCIIDEGHPASARVATKHGYREQCRTTYKGTPIVLYERKLS